MSLLAVMRGTYLHSLVFLFLLVGHTHNKLDRFFSRIRVTLQGRTYYTMDDMIRCMKEAIAGFTFDFQHLTDAWDFQSMRHDTSVPKIKYL